LTPHSEASISTFPEDVNDTQQTAKSSGRWHEEETVRIDRDEPYVVRDGAEGFADAFERMLKALGEFRAQL
jgi:hypothetical protein